MERPTRAWPHIRAALIALHVLSIVVLSTPGSAVMTNKRGWTTPNAEAELQAWSERLAGWGYETTPHELRDRLYRVALSAGGTRDRIAWPFVRYGRLTGAQQGWQMFVRPQKHPAELHVDIEVDGQWRPLVRPWDASLSWRRGQRRHNRVRKLLGRFARTFYPDRYRQTARWFATRAAVDFPEATAVRVRLFRVQSPTAAEVRADREPEGRYEHEQRFDAEALR